MSSATGSGDVAGEAARWAAEAVVECDAGSECCEACEQPYIAEIEETARAGDDSPERRESPRKPSSSLA